MDAHRLCASFGGMLDSRIACDAGNGNRQSAFGKPGARGGHSAPADKGGEAMDVLMRIFAGVVAAWITPDPVPQQTNQTAQSSYEDRCNDMRCRLRIVR